MGLNPYYRRLALRRPEMNAGRVVHSLGVNLGSMRSMIPRPIPFTTICGSLLDGVALSATRSHVYFSHLNVSQAIIGGNNVIYHCTPC